MKNKGSRIAGLLAGLVFCLVAVPNLLAATLEVSEDSPVSFRASFRGTDTNPSSIEGNDFQVFTLKFWTVLVNLRCDGLDGYGNAFGFYEIQLTHTGSAITGLYRRAASAREKPALRSPFHCMGVRTPLRSPRKKLSPMPISSP